MMIDKMNYKRLFELFRWFYKIIKGVDIIGWIWVYKSFRNVLMYMDEKLVIWNMI